MKRKNLFIIASDYPFGPGEPFLETELEFISSQFNMVYFIVTTPGVSFEKEMLFYLPENSEILFFNKKISVFSKILTFRFLFSRLFLSELWMVKSFYKIKINFLIIKIMLNALLKSKNFIEKFGSILKEKQIDINDCLLYSYWFNEFPPALAMIRKKFPKVKAFTRAHRWDLYMEWQNPPYLPFRIFSLKNLDAIFTISDNGRNYIQEKYINYQFKNIIVSRLGTQSGYFDKMYHKGQELNLLSIACINDVKRIEMIIDTLAAISSFKISWTHIGGGKKLQVLTSYAQGKLKDRINIKWVFPGSLKKSQIYGLLRDQVFDLLINTSYSEGIPVSMMEAMSFGIPVIGTNVGGVSEIIEHNVNGFLLPPNPSPVEIAEVLEKFWNFPEEILSGFRENAFNTWKTKYNAENNYNIFLEELRKINK